MSGTLHLVGVGPGDPELMTLRAARILATTDVVAYPVSNEDTTIALDIARAHVRPGVRLEEVRIPMTPGPKDAIYVEAATRLAAHLDAGRDVAYLCEGDPLFYGTALYLLAKLQASHPVAVVPGVTSMTAAAATIPLPLAAGNETLTVLPGPLDNDALRSGLAGMGTVAILKIGRHFDRIRAALEEAGRANDAWLVERATTPAQTISRLRDLPAGEKPYFSLVLSPARAESSRP